MSLNRLPTPTEDVRTFEQKFAEEGKLFIVSSNIGPVTGSSEQAALLIRNPVGSGKILRVGSIIANIPEVSSFVMAIRVYGGPTVTADGSALTVSKMNIGGTISPVTKFFQSPTTTSFGTFRSGYGATSGVPFSFKYDFSLLAPPDNEVLLTVDKASASSNNLVFTIIFAEEDE